MSSPESAVLFEVSHGVATITLNRPDQMNTINGDLGARVMDSLRQVRAREDIRVAVLTGNGRAFCAGADLRSRADGPAAASGVAGLFRTDESPGFHEFDAKKPLIGAVSRVVPAVDLLPTAHGMAQRIASYAPLAVRSMLELVKRQGTMPEGEAMHLASTMGWAIGQTADAKEGPRAFAEKRTPVFRGE
jgi:enoyl-CoA hydratase/carnithine racemase